MRFGHFFIDRPIFAAVLSIVMVMVGSIAYVNLPISQYPEVVPPTIVVSATYPGANAQTVAETVATPLEQSINGVEDMIYMSSYSTSSGTLSLTVTFKIGTDLDIAQVLVQNRVNTALPRLPQEVRNLGVTTNKSSPDMMMVINLFSPDESLDQLYVSNYAILRLQDQLTRLDGVGEVRVFGAREYAIRIWLDPEKIAATGMTAGDIIAALRAQNVQVSAGGLGQPPVDGGNAYQFTISTQGRFDNADQFKQVIVRTGADGAIIRLGDVARVELGAKDYVMNGYLDGTPAIGIAMFQRPGSNALASAELIQQKMKEMSKDFPKGLEYKIAYNPTEFIAQSIDAVYATIFEAVALVVLVVIIFLQSWRASLIPILTIPVSLVGTFAVMAGFGLSLNMLTLFGLVLSIGIVVDDAIVVVENMERHIAEGASPTEAAHKTMDEVGGAVIAIALVLCAVFVPTAFIPGMSGRFYNQFAMTISVATVISAFNSLTLSPAMGALLLRRHEKHEDHKPNLLMRPFSAFARGFNKGFDKMGNGYGRIVGSVTRKVFFMLVLYVGLIIGTGFMANKVPTGFIPMQDQGYGIVVVQLPDGASLARTDAVVKQATKIMLETPGVAGAVGFAGLSGATFTSASNAGTIFARFKPFEERVKAGNSMMSVIGDLQARLSAIEEAFIIVVPPPPVRGIGNAGGFKMMVEDRMGRGLPALLEATGGLIGQAATDKTVTGVYTTFTANSPQVFVEIDRTKAQMLGIPLANVFETLQVYLGSTYVNDFNAFGRVYQVTAQADLPFRLGIEDIGKLKTRNDKGEFVPLGTIVTARYTTGADLIQRYNQYVAIPVSGNTAPGASSGQALESMEKIAESLPQGMGTEWTELALQQKEAGNAATYIFGLSVIFVFLVLAAMYESWSLPLAIILIVPMSVLSALIGVHLREMDNNILTQIGLVVLIGLAAKNAILIVEFARHLQEQGEDMYQAIKDACRLRLRPILMTSFAFILGVVPLVIATGPGAEMRQSMGTAVFAGMIGVTIFGLILTPVFYSVIQRLTGRTGPQKPKHPHPPQGTPAAH